MAYLFQTFHELIDDQAKGYLITRLDEGKTELSDRRVFAYSRNHVFLGVIVSYLGKFLIILNVLSFSLLWITYIVIQIQVRLQEEYLTNVHG